MHEMLINIEGLLLLINGLLAFIAGLLVLMGWHLTEPRLSYAREAGVLHELPPLIRRIQRTLAEQGTCHMSSMSVVSRGTVLPNERSYMANGETLPLPPGVELDEGRSVALVLLPA